MNIADSCIALLLTIVGVLFTSGESTTMGIMDVLEEVVPVVGTAVLRGVA